MLIKVYTDGACSNNGYENAIGGYAFALFREGEEDPYYSLAKGPIHDTTNNECELLAVLTGCKEAAREKEGNIVVYSDSAYIMNCYKDKWYKKWQKNGWKNAKKEPVANKELWEQIIPFFEDKRFSFQKVKGHADDARNNYVDKLAVMAKES